MSITPMSPAINQQEWVQTWVTSQWKNRPIPGQFSAEINTGAYPNSGGAYTISSLLDLMRWDATDQIDLIDQPLLMIAGSKADSLYMSEDAFAKATGTKDKELFKIEGATHIETYWIPKYVEAAMGKLSPFFARTLGSGRT